MRVRDENKIAAIRAHAIGIISRDGIDGFAMNGLARAARVSPGTLYIYYRDKEDLLIQLCTAVSQEILSSSVKGLKAEMSFKEGLSLQWKNRFRYLKNFPLEVRFVEQLRYSPLYRKVSAALEQNHGDLLGSFMSNAVSKNELIALPFEVYWSLAFAPLYQLVKFEAREEPGALPFTLSPALYKKALDLVIKGLTP